MMNNILYFNEIVHRKNIITVFLITMWHIQLYQVMRSPHV
jgi:hypothetical protein